MILSFTQFINEGYSPAHKTALSAVMKSRKVKHSKEVADLVSFVTSDDEVYNAALYHDYIERGGKVESLQLLTSPRSVDLVMALTKTDDDFDVVDSKNATLGILQHKLNKLPVEMHDDVIVIKCADRISNLLKRKDQDILSRGYLRKSAQLIQFLYDECSPLRKAKLAALLKSKLLKAYPKMGKRMNLVL